MPAYKNEETNTWEISFYYVDWTGKRKRKHKRNFRTKKEALEYERSFKVKSTADLSMTLAEFVEIYFQDKSGELKLRTKQNKQYMIETHVTPYLGDRKVNEISPPDIIAWQNKIREKNYSDSYNRMLQNQLTALFTHAERIYGLTNNPSKRVKKMGNSGGRSLTFWTYEEYIKFRDTFEVGSKYYLIFEILFWTGCRVGELLALTWDDFDFTTRKMSISKTYYRNNGTDIITTPKTVNSIRTVDIPNFLLDEVKEYYYKLYEYPKNARLFPIVHEAVQHTMKYHIKKAGVKKIRVHDLRHSACAFLIHKGIPPLVIKERMGHKDIKITLNTYGHLYPSEQRKVADLLDMENEKSPNSGNCQDLG